MARTNRGDETSATHPVRPWYACNGNPCRCAKPQTVDVTPQGRAAANDLLVLAGLLDKHFDLVADLYGDAVLEGRGLEDVIAALRTAT